MCPPTIVTRQTSMNMTMIARTAALVSSLKTVQMDQARRLEELFDRHHQRLYRLARRLSATHDDARDLVQETYLRAAQKPTSVPAGMSSEEAWLVRVLINLCRDRWRQQAVRRRNPASAYAPPTAPSGEEAAIARATIWRALQKLAPRRRAIVIMCELEGLSIPSVARTMGVAAVTVRWHLSKGRRELVRVIGTQGKAEP
jgi:RNA polymerase sigma-70 factor (ECF subfamily)